jgi:hypothetical protein
MKIQKYIFPVFVSTNLLGQTTSDVFPNIKFGFTHSVYTSTCFNSTPKNSFLNQELKHKRHPSKITEAQYGFGIGLFMWMPLNEGLIFKPKIEGSFSTSCLKQNSLVFATCFDLSISHGFVIALKEPDKEGIIYCARNMSCYLTSKQPYLLIGPKINLKKFDKGFINKGFQNELSFGFFLGYGINYVFQGKNFAPEICYNISSTSQNKINDTKKITHTISLTVNFF